MAWWAAKVHHIGPPPQAYRQTGVAQSLDASLPLHKAQHPRSGAESAAHLDGDGLACVQGVVRQLRSLKRLLVLEEMAMEDHIRR